MGGAHCLAGSAVCALAIVDSGHEIYMDCIIVAGLLAFLAFDAGHRAALNHGFPLIQIAAVHKDPLDLRDQFHEELGAGLNTDAAGRAFLAVDLGQPVDHFNGVERTGGSTGAKAETAIIAGLGAAETSLGQKAGIGPLILVKAFGCRSGSIAFDPGNQRDLADLSCNPEKLANGLSGRRTPNRAGSGRSSSLKNRCTAAGAAREATGSAVGSWKSSDDLIQFGIRRNMEFLACVGQDQAQDKAENKENQYSLPHYRIPPKPIKPKDMKAATIKAMGSPLKALGISASSSCSRMAEKRVMTSRKPNPLPRA